MRSHGVSWSALLSLFMLLAGAPAFAQSQPPAQPDASPTADPAQKAPPPPAPTPLTFERVPSGWVVSPDVTFTEVNKRSATMVGAYGGWLQDRMWLFGAGGYWMANEDHDFQMAYGGLVSQFIARSDRRIGFGIKGLVGGGDATIAARYGDVYGTPIQSGPPIVFGGGHHQPHPPGRPPSGGITPDTRVVFNEVFFIPEPQAQLMWNVSDHVRITFGAGYRITAGGNEVNDRLRGPIGSLSVEFGGGH